MLKQMCFYTLCLFCLFSTAQAQGDTETATVYQTVNLRGGPDTRFPIVGQLSEGDTVTLNGRDASGRWLHVVADDGLTGWVPLFILLMEMDPLLLPEIEDSDESVPGATPPDELPPGVQVIAYGRVNVRSGPGIAYDIQAQLEVQEQASALARSSHTTDWLYIENEQHSGWVAYFTVYVVGDPQGLPIRVPDVSGEGLIPPSSLVPSRFNTRLHSEPDINSPETVIVPFEGLVQPLARTEDRLWLYVAVDQETGWSLTEMFDIPLPALEDLPVYHTDAEYRIQEDGTIVIIYPEATEVPAPAVTETPAA